jgi:prevent-host-death family protein
MYNLGMSAVPEEMPATEARNSFAEVIGWAHHAGVTTYITSHGRRVAAIVPVEAAETLERLEEAALTAMAKAALDEPGVPIPHDVVVERLGL